MKNLELREIHPPAETRYVCLDRIYLLVEQLFSPTAYQSDRLT